MAIEPRTLGILKRPRFQSGLWSWIATVDHKRIGILYLWTAFFFFLVGGTEAWLFRLQLAYPDNRLMKPDTYNALFTMHGTTMIFLAIMPLLSAFQNFLLPLMIGARDVAFPKLNAFSYWNYLLGAIFLNIPFINGNIPDQGWYAYAPLTLPQHTLHQGPTWWSVGLILLGTGSLVSAFNFIVTVINMRCPGMTLMRMPVFVWTSFIIAIMVIFAFPAFTVALIMLLFDRNFAGNFFNNVTGANVLLWQHVFWTFGHPEVYIMILPAFGIISEILPVFARKPLFGYTVIVFTSALIAFMGFTVWVHHMFAVGLAGAVNIIFAATTAAISVPTGVKIFNWLATLWGGQLRFTTAMKFAVSFLVTFTIGGLSGFMHSLAPADTQQNDTYFIVAHFHYVLVGGTMMAIFAGMYYWFPKMFGRLLDERLGNWSFWLIQIGFNVWAFPLHFLGLLGQPRRTWTYSADQGWGTWNFVSTVGVFILATGLLVLVYNFAITMRKKPDAVADPWDGRTLEWTIPSPPPEYNFKQTPVVATLDDFFYRKYPQLRDGHKVTPPEPKPEPHGIHMPGQSYMPFALAFSNTVIGFGLVWKNYVLIGVGAVLTILSLFGWTFEGEGGYHIHPEGGD